MSFPNFRLLSQLGAGVDGVSYTARDERDKKTVVLHHLVHAPRDDERWPRQRRQLQLAAKIEDDELCEVRACELADPQHPWVVVLRPKSRLATLLEDGPVDRDIAIAWATELARALSHLHHAGLAHGALTPNSVFLDENHRAHLDAIVVETGAGPVPSDRDLECLPPGEGASPAADVYALACVLHICLTGRVRSSSGRADAASATSTFIEIDPLTSGDEVTKLLSEMRDEEPAWRPTAEEVAFRLTGLQRGDDSQGSSDVKLLPSEKRVQQKARKSEAASAQTSTESTAAPGAASRLPELGRYRDLVEIGEGAMGRVYKAIDPTTGDTVALKVLTGDWRAKPKVLRRFQKEARLLSEIENPYVARFLELANTGDTYFIAVEFVEGTSLGEFLDENQKMPPKEALAIAIDIARGLVDAHGRGIIHRDIKPDNILLTTTKAQGAPRGKLVDFGIARHIDETESLAMTRQGGVLGTPLYMAPEQCAGDPVDERADVYALGSTLFHMLAGRAPFIGGGPQAIMAAKMKDRAPSLRTIVPDAAEPIVHLVAHALEQDRDARIPSAEAFIEAAEEALGMRARQFTAHPQRPNSKSSKRYVFEWDLDAAPPALWPYVSNSERVNRALGLSAMEARFEVRNQGEENEDVVQFAHMDHLGLSITWREHPYEWVEGRRMGILREFSEGPFVWFLSTVELIPLDNGKTHLVHTIEIEPRGVLGFATALVEISVKARRNLDRVYRRIERLLAGGGAESGSNLEILDAFEPSRELKRDVESRVEGIESKMVGEGASAIAVERLGAFVRGAPAVEIARIRPIPFARRFDLEPDDVVDACLIGAKQGMFELMWDLLCPTCRVPAALETTLKNLKDHAHCEACNLDFDLDLASGVEMVFASHPQVRLADAGLYCAASPAHSPHVVAQVRVAPGERFEVALDLIEGTFRLSSRQLPWAAVFNVHARAQTSRWDVKLSEGLLPDVSRSLKPGHQVLVFDNDTGREVVIRIERTAASHEAFTAARAAAHPLFRKLFPGEVLGAGRLVSVANVILLLISAPGVQALYEEMTESDVYAELHRLYFALEEHIGKEGGAMIKLIGSGVVASFADPAAAVRAALEINAAVGDQTLAKDLRIAAHQGPALAVTVNGRLDYFGRTVSLVDELIAQAKANTVVLSETLSGDPVVASLLRTRRTDASVIEIGRDSVAHRISLTMPTKIG